MSPLIPCIVARDADTLLWPLSREVMPKPFMRLGDGFNLLRKTFERVAGLGDVTGLRAMINRKLLFRTLNDYRPLNPGRLGLDFLLGAMGRNTAPAIADARATQDVRFIAKELKKRGHEAYRRHRTVTLPWGTYALLAERVRFKITRIKVRLGESLSLQMHRHRSEHRVVVSGMAQVVSGERDFLRNTNESTFIPAGHSYRPVNPGVIDPVMIEVQSGEYLGEDDIVRFTDIYGRVSLAEALS